MEERQLIQNAIEGDARAERALFDSHVDRVWRLAYRMTGDSEFAKDLTQDVFIRAFERLAQFRGDSTFGSWLHRITVTITLNALKKAHNTRLHEPLTEKLCELPTATQPDDPGLKQDLSRAINSLDDTHRMVFVMHDLEGYTHQEIGEAMGTPVGTTKARLSRSRAKLRVWFSRDDLLTQERKQ